MNTLVSVAAIASAAAIAAPSIAHASEPDESIKELWKERTAVVRKFRATYAAFKEAEAKMPEWAQPGPHLLHPDGTYGGSEVGWPRIEGVSAHKYAVINVRPNLAEIADQFQRKGVYTPKTLRGLEKAVVEFRQRVARQEAEKVKVGLDKLGPEMERLVDESVALMEQIEAVPVISPTKTAVMFMIAMTRGYADDDLADDAQGTMADAILPLIRPHLSGLIAEHVDDLIEDPSTPHGERDFW